MRALSVVSLAFVATIALAGVARADIETVDRNGMRWRWIPGTRACEVREVVVPGRWDCRRELVADPGRWETRTRNVWRPGCVTWEVREQFVAARWCVEAWGHRGHWEPARTICVQVPIQQPGHWECCTENVWIPGCTRWVDRQVWIPAHCEQRTIAVESAGHWIQLGYERPVAGAPSAPSTSDANDFPATTPVATPARASEETIVTPIPLGVTSISASASSSSSIQGGDTVVIDLVSGRRGPNW